MDDDPFPVFFFDCNTCCGKIDSVARWEWLLQNLEMCYPPRECALKHALDATCMVDPSRRSWSSRNPNDFDVKLGMGIEQWGRIANFGWRSEHCGGEVTLREWLRAKGWLYRLLGIPETH